MKKICMDILVGMLVVVFLLPSVTGALTIGNKKQVFKECYIEASGEVERTGSYFIRYVMWKHFWFRPYNDDRAFVLFWRVAFMEPKVSVTIYTEKNGDILWEDTEQTGIWGLWLWCYYGVYTNDGTTDDQLVIKLQGTAKVAIVYFDE